VLKSTKTQLLKIYLVSEKLSKHSELNSIKTFY